MKRKLLRQICNEWTANVWLCVELLIVSVVMWYITDLFYTSWSTYHEPRGFATDHCYLIKHSTLSPKSAEYKPYEGNGPMRDDFIKLFEALQSRPEVEAVAAGFASYFYNGSNAYLKVQNDSLGLKKSIHVRTVSQDFPIVFDIHGINGETPQQLSELIRDNMKNGFLASANLLGADRESELRNMVGKTFDIQGDTLVLAGLYKTARYDDYRSADQSASIIIPSRAKYLPDGEIMVRIKPKMDRNFADNLMKEADNYRFGNFYIAAVTPFSHIRDMYHREKEQEILKMGVALGFLALNIFLGILGTFWFRTRQRTGEIALRMVCGATRGMVFRRVVAEGELLLLIVTPIAIVIDWLLTRYELCTFYLGDYFVASRFTVCVLISWSLLALMIFLGSLFPALRATRIVPAVALKDE